VDCCGRRQGVEAVAMGRCWFYPTAPRCRSASLLCALMQFPHFELPLATTHHFPRQLRLLHPIAPATKWTKSQPGPPPTVIWAPSSSSLWKTPKNQTPGFTTTACRKIRSDCRTNLITRFNLDALLVRILYSNIWTDDLESLRSSWLVVSSARAN